ncbi:D-xylose transporter XylE [Halalkalibacter alkaliphilus]|uniref:D-xylose transporter XylE n=1 Tax=Halalkalibacter alkaliphilus TaxID=2917993 RepID=A0A9X2CUS3_9BACI|nr:D-xylose transporter XylE [Halalkalibacter alkaliphilus]MCL7748490.1 D-xylose transporter XylE [Halalkalibacter alkaliphilus]
MKENSKKSNRYILTVVSTVALAGLLFGYDTAVISGAEQSIQRYLIDSLGLGSFAHGVTVSSALIGCVIGGIISGFLANKIGRKHTLILAAVLFFISALGSAYPELLFFTRDNPTMGLLLMFNFYRVLGGIGVGMASAIAPVYISEITPKQSRGKFVALYTLSIGIGALLVYIVNLLIAAGQSTAWIDDIGWRYMIASEMIPALLFLLLLFFVPETPRYLASKQEYTKAFSILQQVNGSKQKAQNILDDIKYSLNKQDMSKAHLFDYGKLVIFIGIAIAIFQQLIGINVILYYAPRIFEAMGAGPAASMLQTVIVGIVNIIFMALAILFVDSLGRKPLLIGGAIGCAISLFCVATLASMNIFGLTTLIFILLYVASFQMSWGVVTWVVVSEIFPNRIRGQAMSIAVALHWLANLTISSTFPPLNDLLGPMTFAIYGLISLVAMVFIWKIVPETKGKTLEELEEIWKKDCNEDNNKKAI